MEGFTGLTINYKLSIWKKLDDASVRELAQRVAVYAKKIGCAAASDVVPANVKAAPLFVAVGKVEETDIFGLIPPKRGWLIEVDPGEGSETATFGLCQYPRRAPFRDGTVPTGYRGGWLLKGHCKTQYAAAPEVRYNLHPGGIACVPEQDPLKARRRTEKARKT